jgi:hypothetical protein
MPTSEIFCPHQGHGPPAWQLPDPAPRTRLKKYAFVLKGLSHEIDLFGF